MAIYRARQGAYKEIYEDKEIHLPDGFELITGGDNDLGHGKYNGLFHWIGCITKNDYELHKDEFKGFNMWTRNFGPLVFITIHNTQFHESYPYLISDKEFNEKWQFRKYRIAEFSDCFRLKNMVQILWIGSEYKIDALEVTNRDYFDQDEFKKIERHPDYSLEGIMSKQKASVHVSDNKIVLAYWNKLLSNVLQPFNIVVPHVEVNIDAAYELVSKACIDWHESFDMKEWDDTRKKAQRLMDFEEITLIS